MTPDELRSLAAVMRELGVFKLTVEGVTIEMSGAALAAAEAERHPTTIVPAQPPTTAADEDEEDRFAFMATEG